MKLRNQDLSSDYTIDHADDMHNEYDGSVPDSSEFVPFRFMAIGPFNIRKQPTNNHYKTFLGEQKS